MSDFRNVAPDEFLEGRGRNPRQKDFTILSAADLVDHQLIMLGDSAGVAIDPTGDICNLYRQPPAERGAGAVMLVEGISRGGRTLDCYDGKLVTYYKLFGFCAAAKMDFDPQFAHDGQTPADVIFMGWTGSYPWGNSELRSIEAVVRGDYTLPADLDDMVPLRFEDWNAAKDFSRGVSHQ